MNIVIVESPAKAKTINKYLGPDYKVIASFGHVRDLPAKDGSVDPNQDFAMIWQVEGKSEVRLKEIAQAVKKADRLILATDPDREGEAISWHITEELRRRKALEGKDVQRVVFNEITRNAILDAMKHPRDLNQELVEAYLARRALDYLVGFTLSPVLWRKLPGSRSAGRVQSVALRLICEREAEIEVFRPREYWTIEATITAASGSSFGARLTQLNGKKLEKFDLPNQQEAEKALAVINAGAPFTVDSIERKTQRRNPPPPFTTSTLQQEASRKLGFGAQHTMRIAQRLYEGVDLDGETVGLISYMRTDSVNLSQEAITACRQQIEKQFGPQYRPDQPRFYKSTAKNAQEAHEAIRPTDPMRHPDAVKRHLDNDQARLYELIWKRTIAAQMSHAELDIVTVDLKDAKNTAQLRATGSTLKFDGFLALYQEGVDDAGEDDETRNRLPALREQEVMSSVEPKPTQHFTEPPPRYSEASLVKKMEELGIGRPSTYASIIQVLQDRNYVKLDKRRFIPEDRGRLVTAFLSNFFDRYVQYNFTANLEEQLDAVSNGTIDWRRVLSDFWKDFNGTVEGTKNLPLTDVITALDEHLGAHFFPQDGTDRDPRLCPGCNEGRLGIKLGKFGAFIGCSNYPDCRYTRKLGLEGADGSADGGKPADMGPRMLGKDPETGLDVTVRQGPYGAYVQLGEAVGKEKPKRASLPKNIEAASLDLDRALRLLSLPRLIGKHPDSGDDITAGIGRFGPYLKHGKGFVTLPADDDILTIGLNRAVTVIAEAADKTKSGKRAETGKVLGEHPDDGKPVTILKGRYGPYAKHGATNATLSKELDPETITLDQAVALLAQRQSSAKKTPARKSKTAPKTAKPAAKTRKKAT